MNNAISEQIKNKTSQLIEEAKASNWTGVVETTITLKIQDVIKDIPVVVICRVNGTYEVQRNYGCLCVEGDYDSEASNKSDLELINTYYRYVRIYEAAAFRTLLNIKGIKNPNYNPMSLNMFSLDNWEYTNECELSKEANAIAKENGYYVEYEDDTDTKVIHAGEKSLYLFVVADLAASFSKEIILPVEF